MSGAVPELWRQQGDVLRSYAKDHVASPDVAVELPTGTGKTIVGLLIAGWRRAALGEQVVYACPTTQLAAQVHAAAGREGIPAVLLVGSHTGWNPAQRSRYEGSEAVAVTNYSTVFNSSPKIGLPGSIVFDDAHAGEQWVAESWSLTLEAHRHERAWQAVMEALRPALDGMFFQRVTSEQSDPAIKSVVRLIVPIRRAGMPEEIDAALGVLPEGSPEFFDRAMIRGGLASCLVYVGWRKVLIRPFVPPTFENRPFENAAQRVYLSATLGHGGELERAFGRATITRLALPEDSSSPRNGRRFFVFPDLVQGGSGQTVCRRIVQEAGKSLILAPTDRLAAETATELTPRNARLFDKSHVQTSLAPFINAPAPAVLALANRYDGLDLPGNSCSAVVLHGLPDAAHLQERFLTDRVRVGPVLEERIRTRVIQGAGRATRQPSDHAIVVVRGSNLTQFLTGRARLQAMEPEVQAEIDFGRDNSRDVTADDMLTAVRMFLEQGEDWRTQAEPHLAQARADSQRVDPPGTEQLARAVGPELTAWACAWRGDWSGAAGAAQNVARELQGHDPLRHYRAFWLYLASVWTRRTSGPTAGHTAAGLLRHAQQAAPGSWISETETEDDRLADQSVDTPGVRLIAHKIETGKWTRAKVEPRLTDITQRLSETDPARYEPALTTLGSLLGAQASKPDGQARSDSAWCFEDVLWVTIEAKSDQKPDGPVAVRDVREANTQMKLLAADRGVDIPLDSFSVIVSPRTVIDPNAAEIAEPHVYLSGPETLQAIAADLAAAWTDVHDRAAGHTGSDLERLVRLRFGHHRVLPSQIRERLTTQGIAN